MLVANLLKNTLFILSNLFEAVAFIIKRKKRTKANKKSVYKKNNSYVKVKLCSLCERTVGVSIKCNGQFKSHFVGFQLISISILR